MWLIKDGGYWVIKEGDKMIASLNPEHGLPSIKFSDEVIGEWGNRLGIVDIDKLAILNNPDIQIYKDDEGLAKAVYISSHKNYKDGYNQALSDNKDKLFTLGQIEEAWNNGFNCGNSLDKIRTVEPTNFIYWSVKPTDADRLGGM